MAAKAKNRTAGKAKRVAKPIAKPRVKNQRDVETEQQVRDRSAEELKRELRKAWVPYTPEVFARVLTEIAGGRSLRSICRQPDMPSMQAVWMWLHENKDLFDRYAQACEERTKYWAEELLDITDDATNDWMERLDHEGQPIGWQVNGEHIQRSRLRVDTRKWLLAKMNPKQFGEKVQVGQDPENPLPAAQAQTVVIDYAALREAFNKRLKED